MGRPPESGAHVSIDAEVESCANESDLSEELTTDPITDLGDVKITGQRATGDSPFTTEFPSVGTLGGDGPLPGGDAEHEPIEETGESVQCAILEGRLQWNTEAKVMDAIPRFYQEALTRHGEPDLANREMGALICEMPNGDVSLGPIESGEPILDANGTPILYYDSNGAPRNPGVAIAANGCGTGRPIAYLHSHPGTNTSTIVPSQADFVFAQHLVDYFNAPANIGIYTTARFQAPGTGTWVDIAARAFLTDKNAALNAITYKPKWVNPNAKPCPGDE